MQVEKYAKSGYDKPSSPTGNDPNAAYKDRMKLFTAVDSFKGSLSSQKIRTVTEKAIKAHAAKGADLTCDCVSVGDGGEGTARETRRRLDVANLLCPEGQVGIIEIYNSSNDEKMIELSKKLLYR